MRMKLKFHSSKLKVQSQKSRTRSRLHYNACESRAAAGAYGNSRKSGSKPPHSRLKLARFLARPALDDDFRFGEEFNRVAALAVKDAKETFFPAAEGEIGHGGGDANIDADISCRRFVTELARGGTAGCEERCLISVGTAAEKVHGLLNGISVNHAEDGTEDFGIGQLAGGGQSVKNRGGEEIS